MPQVLLGSPVVHNLHLCLLVGWQQLAMAAPLCRAHLSGFCLHQTGLRGAQESVSASYADLAGSAALQPCFEDQKQS